MIVGLSIVVLVGFVGIVADIGAMYHERRLEQRAADAAALAGASELYRGPDSTRIVTAADSAARRHGYITGTNGVVVTVNRRPKFGHYVGNPQYVEVIIRRQVPPLFSRLLGFNQATPVPARAVAGVAAPGKRCVYALDFTAEKALNVNSNSHLTVTCGVTVNSSAYNGLDVTSAGSLTATGGGINVTGGANGSGWTPTPTTGVPREPDPLAYLPMPTLGTVCNFTKVEVKTNPHILSPGVYCGDGDYAIKVTSSGRAVFTPGLYVLRSGLEVSGGIVESTGGVTFINTNAIPSQGGAEKFKEIKIGSESNITLTAMTTGSLAGILFYQDPAAGKPGVFYENIISSKTSMTLTGTLYFPTQKLILAHSGSTVNITGGVVARMVDVTSGSNVTFTNPPAATTVFKRISLVE